jgi:hypothetical protein
VLSAVPLYRLPGVRRAAYDHAAAQSTFNNMKRQPRAEEAS